MKTKLKNLVMILLCTVSLMALCFAITACNTKHTHTADSTWHADETYHWHNCTADDGEEMDKAEHTWQTKYSSEGHWQECTVCGYTTAVTAHTTVNHDARAATCTEEGWDAYVTCSDCDYTTYSEVSALGHDYAFIWSEDGTTATYVCSHDSSHTLEVTMTSESKEATCTENSYTVYTATASNGNYETRNVEGSEKATGHTNGTPVRENSVTATCTQDGSYDTVVYCTVCGEEVSRTTTTVQATGHTAGTAVHENVVEATCTEDGSYESVVYCTVCEEEISRTATTVQATGHTYGSIWYEDSESQHYQKCTVCGTETDHEAHTSSCISDDESGHHSECSVCGKTLTETVAHTYIYTSLDEVDADKKSELGINYNSSLYHLAECSDCNYWTLEGHTKRLTELTNGFEYNESIHYLYCTICEHTYGEYNHVLLYTSDDDYHWQYCSGGTATSSSSAACGYTSEKEAHTWSETYSYSDGSGHYRICTVCGHWGAVEDHDEDGWEITDTTHYYSCTTCGYTIETANHLYNADNVCTVCGYEYVSSGNEEHNLAWTYDNDGHCWQYCTDDGCEYTTNYGEHVYGLDDDGYYSGDGTCDRCGLQGIYTITSEGVLTGYVGSFEKIKLPTVINEITLLAIGDSNGSMTSGVFNSATFIEIIIPSTVVTIDQYAFAKCALVSIEIPDTVTTLGKDTFYLCQSLSVVTIGAGITELPASMFQCTASKLGCLSEVWIKCTTMPTINSCFKNNCTDLKIYFNFGLDTFDSTKINDTNISASNFYFYQDSQSAEDERLNGYGGTWYYGDDGYPVAVAYTAASDDDATAE